MNLVESDVRLSGPGCLSNPQAAGFPDRHVDVALSVVASELVESGVDSLKPGKLFEVER